MQELLSPCLRYPGLMNIKSAIEEDETPQATDFLDALEHANRRLHSFTKWQHVHIACSTCAVSAPSCGGNLR
jgi:hypothetical protein